MAELGAAAANSIRIRVYAAPRGIFACPDHDTYQPGYGRAVQPYQAAGEGGDELERSADDHDDSHLLSTLPILLTDFEHLASVITSQFSVYNTHSELLFGSLK